MVLEIRDDAMNPPPIKAMERKVVLDTTLPCGHKVFMQGNTNMAMGLIISIFTEQMKAHRCP